MKLAIIGAGYVGLVTGACFAEMGNDVILVDAEVTKVEALEQGRIPIYEPGLEDYVKRNVRDNRLRFTTDLATAVQQSLVCFIAVGTPQDRDGSADLSMVLQVAREIGRHMNGYKVIVEKSTVPVGTAVQVRQVIQEELAARGEVLEFDVESLSGAAGLPTQFTKHDVLQVVVPQLLLLHCVAGYKLIPLVNVRADEPKKSWGLAQPYSSTKRDAPPVAVHGWAATNSP